MSGKPDALTIQPPPGKILGARGIGFVGPRAGLTCWRRAAALTPVNETLDHPAHSVVTVQTGILATIVS